MLPQLLLDYSRNYPIPDEKACLDLWDKYAMLPNIRAHSRAVADVCDTLAAKANAAGFCVNGPELRAAALLHDIAKTYTVHYRGAHDQLGAAITREETGNFRIAQAVLYHVLWPWTDGPLALHNDPFRLPLLVSYADKRVRHDKLVTLQERFDDLIERYGHTEVQRGMIRKNHEQAVELERELIKRLGAMCLD